MDQYNLSVNELKNLEKDIKDCIRQLKENQEENTVRLEQSTKKKLDEYSSKVVKLFNEYQSTKAKANLTDREFSRRVNEIQEFKGVFDNLKNSYDGQIDAKYKYKSNFDPTSKYSETDEMRDMSNRQLFDYQQKKLKNQDKDIEEIIGYAKEGKEINKELKTELLKQNRQLDDIEMDIDRVDSNMNKTKQKFINFIKTTSNCSLMIIIILELIALLAIIVFW